MFAIDDMLKVAKNYDHLLELLKAEGIEIKQGAHLAMKLLMNIVVITFVLQILY